MLLARLLLGPWSLCLIPMRSAFKLLLSEVPEMGGGGAEHLHNPLLQMCLKGLHCAPPVEGPAGVITTFV